MQRKLSNLTEGLFDLLVIGGGIFGAGVARDAALRGLRVALIDQNDFASGTSSRSSKLIHGGFRYLEQYDFGLVAESSRERRILREIAPHRVKPLPLLLPVYENDKRQLWHLRLGMTLYDLLAMYRNVAVHRTLSPADALELEPTLQSDSLVGAIQFYDCQEDDARFCIDNVMHAAELGAVCANYCEVIGLHQAGDRIISARVRDNLPATLVAQASPAGMPGSATNATTAGTAVLQEGQKPDSVPPVPSPADFPNEFEIRAKVFINAAGPWVERVAGFVSDEKNAPPRLSPTKGVHILMPRLTQSHGIFFQGRQDSRMMFVLPWNDCTLIGTTDTDFHGDPANVHADAADIEYLLTEARWLFPEGRLTPSPPYSGERAEVRGDFSSDATPSMAPHPNPLPRVRGRGNRTDQSLCAADVIASFAGIRPLVQSDAKNPSARSRDHQIIRRGENLLSLAGGKYTTYRLIAKQAVDQAYQMLGQNPEKCRTATTPIPDFRPKPSGEKIADSPQIYASDIEHALKNEMAITLDDIMRRRTGLALSRFGGLSVARQLTMFLQVLPDTMA